MTQSAKPAGAKPGSKPKKRVSKAAAAKARSEAKAKARETLRHFFIARLTAAITKDIADPTVFATAATNVKVMILAWEAAVSDIVLRGRYMTAVAYLRKTDAQERTNIITAEPFPSDMLAVGNYKPKLSNDPTWGGRIITVAQCDKSGSLCPHCGENTVFAEYWGGACKSNGGKHGQAKQVCRNPTHGHAGLVID